MKLFYIIFAVLCFTLIKADQSLQCGDWDAFKDELCYKIFDNREVQSYSDAKNKCSQFEHSSLASIRSQEEQDFLFTLLHVTHKTVNDVWIGGEYKENKLKLVNNLTVNYTNWATGNPVNVSGYECVKMVLDEPYRGKWFNALCDKLNVVVCQKEQNWLFNYLQKIVMEQRKLLEVTILELERTKNNLYAEITKRTAESTPPGTIAYFAKTTALSGWLKANGQTVSRIQYVNLFATIGTTFGSGDGSTTFTLPDLRGEFIRGWSDGRDVDTYRAFGSFQWGSSIPLAGQIGPGAGDRAGAADYHDRWHFTSSVFDEGFESNVPSGQTRNGLTFPNDNITNEMNYITTNQHGVITHWNVMKGTRPRNIALLACIKF